mgnify:CR=1 FL=1
MMTLPADPPRDCGLCPRLEAFRTRNRAAWPAWFNAPVPAFGPVSAPLLIVGLAPGLKGANRTGRPFTGDDAGDLLYATLTQLGLGQGIYGADAGDGFTLIGCRVTNAVRCVPPENKPTGAEVRACGDAYLAAELAALPHLRVAVALGRIAHDAVLRTLGRTRAHFPFAHGAEHVLSGAGPSGGDLILADSYHCSRYNTNTRRLTPAMFEDVLSRAARRATEKA